MYIYIYFLRRLAKHYYACPPTERGPSESPIRLNPPYCTFGDPLFRTHCEIALVRRRQYARHDTHVLRKPSSGYLPYVSFDRRICGPMYQGNVRSHSWRRRILWRKPFPCVPSTSVRAHTCSRDGCRTMCGFEFHREHFPLTHFRGSES